MRHRKNNRRLGRKNSHREATLRSLACALFEKESIRTTKVRAKEARSFIDNLIAIAKNNTPESRREVFALIRDKNLIEILFNVIAPRFKTRSSGYTRIIPIYPRRGDGSPMAILELVEKRPVTTTKKAKPKKEKEVRPQPNGGPPPAEKKEEKPKLEEKKEHKVAPEPKADVKEEKRQERAREEEKKIKKGGLFRNLRRYFRGKSP